MIIDTEVGFSKPDIDIFQIALDRLSLTPKDVWMIGDNLVWDVYGPQKLGIFSVWNDFDKRGLPKDANVKPDMTVNSVCELVNILKESK